MTTPSPNYTVRCTASNGKQVAVEWKARDLTLAVTHGEHRWESLPPEKPDLRVGSHSSYLHSARSLSIASFERGDEVGLRCTASSFAGVPDDVNAAITLELAIERNSGDVLFRVIPQDERTEVAEVAWPPAFATQASPGHVTVVPTMQGFLLPGNWPRETSLDKVWPYSGWAWSRGLTMPWWGQIRDGHGYLAILETPFDGGIDLQHPPGGPTIIGPRWRGSRGLIRYHRTVRYRFFDRCTHVTLAKAYRSWAEVQGRVRTLAEKSAENPRVLALRGTGVIHTSILYHVQPSSPYFSKVENPHDLRTFHERAEELGRLAAEHRLTGLYVHLDGWGRRGYDNLHPDVLPPCEEAGGWEGMSRLASECERLGYIFATHDQYRDYYLDADTYTDELAIRTANGVAPRSCEWFGGPQAILCAERAAGYLARNLDEIARNGVNLTGIYLDVFAAADLDECYHPDHPMTREQCAAARNRCFALARARGLVVSSEEPMDFAIPYLDLVHHGPYPQHPAPGEGPALGIPAPLFSLVYHDCLVIPWTSLERGGWGIPPEDSGFLHALLNGGVPYVSLAPSPEYLAKVEVVRDLHRSVGWDQMEEHEFLDESCRVQRTTFTNGTRVLVDFDKDTYEITRG